MRVPEEMLPVVYQSHVVAAVRRSSEVDPCRLYESALRELMENPEVADGISELRSKVQRAISGKLKGEEIEHVIEGSALIALSCGSGIYNESMLRFNSRFMNGKGLGALATALAYDLMGLDAATFDTDKGHIVKQAAHGPRLNRKQKRLGPKVQKHIKQLESAVGPALEEAADRYIVYRFLDCGCLPAYKRRMELAGNSRGKTYLGEWFAKFDDALGFPGPPELAC